MPFHTAKSLTMVKGGQKTFKYTEQEDKPINYETILEGETMKAELVINRREVITPYSRDKEVPNRFDLKKLKQAVMRLLPGSVFIAVTVFIVSFVASIAIKLESREIITQFCYAMAKVVWLVL